MSKIVLTRLPIESMTDEEKRERKRVKQREYMNRRRKEDLEFAKSQRELCKLYKLNNPDIICYDEEKRKQYNAQYYLKKKNRLKELEELVKNLNIAN